MKNSKNTLFKLTLIILLVCTACTRTTYKATDYLTQAEKLVWTVPDSTLQILESIPNREMLIGKEQADYVLLLTLAQHRCNIPISSDLLLINLAVDYYKDRNDADRKGAALYIKGCALEEKYNNIPNAIITFKEAETYIPDMGNTNFITRIYSTLGYFNESSFNFELAKAYYRKALHVNTTAKDTISQASDLLNLSTLYYVLLQADSADWCLDHLKEMAESINDSALQVKIYNNIANQNIYKKKYVEAEKYLLRAIKLSPTHSSAKTLLGLANLYQHIGHKEKSDSLFTSLLSCPDMAVRANVYLYLLNDFLTPYPKEQSYFNYYTTTVDSIYKKNRTKELRKIQQQYDNEVLARANDQLHFKWISSIVIAIIIIIVLGAVLGNRLRRMSAALQKRIEELERKKEVLIHEYENTSQQKDMHYTVQINELEKQINDLHNEKRRLKYSINNILKAKEENTEDDYTNIFRTYLSITRQKVYNSEVERAYLHHWLNLTNHNFADKLTATYPQLSGRYVDVCYLTALNLNIKEIATLLKVDERTIERYISNICKEIGFNKGGKNIFISFINSIKDSEA